MTLIQIIQILKQIALVQPNIKSATDGSIYDVMNTNPSVKYDVVHFSQTTHQSDETTDYYGLNIFYVSRLEDSLEDNRLQIQSIGKEVLDNIIRTFCENWGIDIPIITYTPFTQKFNDLCAGCYCNLRLEIPKEILCADDYIGEVIPSDKGIRLQDISITIKENGVRVVTPAAEYDGIGEIRIETNVPQSSAVLQYKEVEYNLNGEYTVQPDEGYDGLTDVAVSVAVPSRYDEGYADGKQDGINEQKAKLETLSVSANGEYTRADGYSAITVDVPQQTGGTYEEGYADGEAAQKAKLTVTSFTENNTYTREDGWSAVTVNVPSDYQDGYADGAADQKAKLSTTSVTENGTYTRSDGYSAITVTVDDRYDEGYEDGEAAQKAKLVSTAVTENGTYSKPDGYSSFTVNVDDRYDEGYEDGYRDGSNVCSGLIISSLTLVVDSVIEDSGVASAIFRPNTAYTDLHYSTSDPTIAAIDENDGIISVISDGNVTICVTDRITGLKSCAQIAVRKSGYIGPFEVIYDVTSTTVPTQIMEKVGRAIFSFDYFTYNGVDYPITRDTTGFTFPTIGRHTVSYHLTGPTVGMAFWGCDRLVEAHIPSYVAKFDGTFVKTSLSSITLNSGLTILYDAFRETNLVSVVLPDTVTDIGELTFTNCHSLVYVSVGNSIEYIGDNAFMNCTALTGLTFPESLGTTPQPGSRIYGWAFCGCTALSHLTFLSEDPAFLVESDHFTDTNNCPICVPATAVETYKGQWGYYKDRITAITP